MAVCALPTYLISWDIYGVFIGLLKNFALDLVAIFVHSLMNYVVFTDSDFKNCYGDTLAWFCCRIKSQGDEKKSQAPAKTVLTSARIRAGSDTPSSPSPRSDLPLVPNNSSIQENKEATSSTQENKEETPSIQELSEEKSIEIDSSAITTV